MVLSEAEQAWDDVIKTSLKSTFLTTLAAIPYLVRPGGRIINMGSIAARSGSRRPGGLAYAAAKAGIEGFSSSLARELAADGITVNTIAPGLIAHTHFFGDEGISRETLTSIVSEIPVARAGEPEDIAAVVAWLADGNSSFVTGTVIPVNGGWRIG
jgi:3-oxoacyl-[acyl-carrier protein] reductase